MKLCVYAICKNESKHVDTWVKGIGDEADYICVLDTGSTDDTLEKFKKYPQVKVVQKTISPWRFDSARNESMKLIPEDTDVAMAIDLDEIYRPGFRKCIEEAFNNGYNLISGYKIIFDENNNQISNIGAELSLPIIADIKNWHWEFPVHEYVSYYDESKIKETVNAGIICEHRPDLSKSRSQYIDILKNWYESSDPPEAICVEKYSIELFHRGKIEESQKVLFESIDRCINHTNNQTGRDTLYRNAFNCSILCRDTGKTELITKYIDMARSSGINSRALCTWESYIYSDIYKDYDKALSALKEALKITEINPKPYIENAELFTNGEIESDMAYFYHKKKQYDKAYEYSQKALKLQPENETFKKNDNLYYRLITNKICVYTTCYNESKFIDKWLKNNEDADHLVALVHDCKDDSEEKFLKAGVSIGHGFYRDWRFDKGKNDALHLAYALAPECNIFVFTSLDEYWDDGWAEEVKRNWVPGETQQCWYNFVQSHDEFGHETGASYFNWMISKDPKWHWEYPIHEAIIYGENEPVNYINLFETVKLQHWPDAGKPRDYLALHKLRWEEYKDDISYLYLVREHVLRGKIKEAYDLAIKFDHEHTNLIPEENAYIWILEGICCEQLNMFEKSIECYKNAYNLNNNLRTPLVRAGVVYAKCGAYRRAEELLLKALKETRRTYSWLEDPWDWRAKPFYWLAYIKLKIKEEEEALGYALFASQIDPSDELKAAYQEILEKCNGR